MPSSPLLTIDQAAERLNVTRGGIYSLLYRGELPSVKLGGRIRRIPADAVEALIERKTRVGL